MVVLSEPTASHHRPDRDPAMDGTGSPALEIHITGRRGHGKSTLVRALADYWGLQGKSVITITSTTPVKDSGLWRRATTGYRSIMPLMGYADIVLVECDLDGHPTAPCIEVWRAELGDPPLSGLHPSIMALVSDGPLPYRVDVPILLRTDISAIAAYLQRLVGGRV